MVQELIDLKTFIIEGRYQEPLGIRVLIKIAHGKSVASLFVIRNS